MPLKEILLLEASVPTLTWKPGKTWKPEKTWKKQLFLYKTWKMGV